VAAIEALTFQRGENPLNSIEDQLRCRKGPRSGYKLTDESRASGWSSRCKLA
jgi:hypothetical protein